MGKFIPDANIDEQVTILEGDEVYLCSAEPTNYTEASATYALTEAGATTWTKANGDVSGRKSTDTAMTGVNITATGDADHVAVCRSSDNSLRHVTTMTTLALTSGGTVNINAHSVEVRDPS